MSPEEQLKIDILQDRLQQLRDSWTVGNYQEVRDEMEVIRNKINTIRTNQSEKGGVILWQQT